jgi:hypothetical protein
MVKQLSLLALVAFSGVSFAVDLPDHTIIKTDQWEMVKEAVFDKMGDKFKQQFNKQYPTPSDDGVRALADQFDECDSCGKKIKYTNWLKTFPPQLPLMIGGKYYRLFEGRMTDVIVEHKKNK